MRKATMTQMQTSDDGTFSRFVSDSGWECFTGELPWRGNAPNKSCIPGGIYPCTWRFSARHGLCYHVDNVPGRSAVEMHAANFVGDAEKGLRSEVLGCIAPGRGFGALDGQLAVLSSREALMALEQHFGTEPFELTIIRPLIF